MSRLKFLISILSYHMARLMAVITSTTSRTRPSSVIAWTTVSIRGLSDSMVYPIRALLVWADTRVGEEEDDTSVRRILLKVSWRDDISGLDKIWALVGSYSEGRAARNPITVIYSR